MFPNLFSKVTLATSGLLLTGIFSAAPAGAAIISYTNQADFLSAIAGAPSTFADNFSDIIPGETPQSFFRSGNGLSATYTASNDDPLYTSPGSLSVNYATDSIVLTFGPGIYAAGGNFYQANNGEIVGGKSMSVSASNGIDPVSTIASPQSSLTDFFGWVSTSPLTILTAGPGSVDAPYSWPTLDNMTLSNYQAPPPASVPAPLPIAGAFGAFTMARRLRCRVAAAQMIHKESGN